MRTYKILVFLFVWIAGAYAQNEDMKYRRSSIYSILFKHSEQKFGAEIGDVFTMIPTPDKYNDHDLSVKVVAVPGKKFVDQGLIDEFLTKNAIAGRLVGKWFDWDFNTGQCGLELIKKRGLYNASEVDKAVAAKSFRGQALLEDAGEQLIGNTFVLVNDIRYIDKGAITQVIGTSIKAVGTIYAASSGNSDMIDAAWAAGDIVSSLKGFKVKITTYLYQLVWDEDAANDFYTNYYSGKEDKERVEAFKKSRGNFKLKYIGNQESSGKSTSFLGINEDQPELMIRKACQRALDENIASLQSNFEAFKIKVPLLNATPITAPIGKKEGLTEDSEFEVLETVVDEAGKTSFERVGVIKPIEKQIWDNRFMAQEEKAFNANLKYTTFKKVSGGKFAPGMLIRQIK